MSERIVSLLPAHDVFVSAFLGRCAVLRRKRPAKLDIGLDSDPDVVAWWLKHNPRYGYSCQSTLRIEKADAVAWLRAMAPRLNRRCVIYLDPPYLMETRSTKRPLYKHEFHTSLEHRHLLRVVMALECHVLISGYDSALYQRTLAGWHIERFPAMTRGGVREECVWCNFQPGAIALHDVRFVGDGFRERERIKRKKRRWATRLAAMPPAERQAVREALEESEAIPASNPPSLSR